MSVVRKSVGVFCVCSMFSGLDVCEKSVCASCRFL